MRSAVIAFLGVSLLAIGQLADTRASARQSSEAMAGHLPEIEGCARHSWSARWIPRFADADAIVLATYHCRGSQTHVAAAQYLRQAPGKEAVSVAHELLPNRVEARLEDHGTRHFDHGLSVRTGSAVEAESWSWYSVGARAHAGRIGAKLDEAWRALSFQTVPSAVFIATIESDDRIERDEVLAHVTPRIWSWYASQVRAN